MKKKALFFTMIVLVLCMTLAGGFSGTVHAASAYKHDFTATTPLGDTHSSVMMWLELFKELSEKSGGRLTGTIYPNSQLANGNMETSVDMVNKGTIDICVVGASILGPYVPELELASVNFLFSAQKQWDDFSVSPACMDFFNGKLAAANYRFLGWMENNWGELNNSVRPIVVPEDLRGLKMRSTTNSLTIASFEAVGASCVATNLGELYTALQQKVVDGNVNGVAGAIHANKLYEVQPYLTMCQLSVSPFACAMNLDLWNQIPAEDQVLFQEVFNKYAAKQIAMNRADVEKNLKDIIDYGVKVRYMTPNEKEQFIKVMGPMSPEVYELMHSTIYDQTYVKALLTAAGLEY